MPAPARFTVAVRAVAAAFPAPAVLPADDVLPAPAVLPATAAAVLVAAATFAAVTVLAGTDALPGADVLGAVVLAAPAREVTAGELAAMVAADLAAAVLVVAVRLPGLVVTARPAAGFPLDGADPVLWVTGRGACCFATAPAAGLVDVTALVTAAALTAGFGACRFPSITFAAACLLLEPR